MNTTTDTMLGLINKWETLTLMSMKLRLINNFRHHDLIIISSRLKKIGIISQWVVLKIPDHI
jgi:hypothetical protein